MSTRVTTRAAATAATTAPAQAAEEPPIAPAAPGGGGGGPPGGGDGGGDGPPGPGPVPPAGPAPVPFALVPAQANQDILDYRTSEGLRLFRSATTNLYNETSEMFDCEPDGLMDFIQLLEDRSNMLGFDTIFQVPDTTDPNNPIIRQFLQNYGSLSLEHVQAHAATYVNAQTRTAQDSTLLYYALMNSLSATGRAKISVCNAEFTVNGVPARVPLLKVIIRESDVDTQATAAHIRTQLASLDEYMGTIDSDINKFNVHIKSLIRRLMRHRETSNNILTNLFKGYKAASSKEQEQILALQTQLKRVQQKANSTSNKTATNKDTGKAKKSTHSGKKSDSKGAKANRDKPEWMLKPPSKDNEGKAKIVDGKDYYWCKALKTWARHKPSECRAESSGKANTDSKKLNFSKALESVTEGDESE